MVRNLSPQVHVFQDREAAAHALAERMALQAADAIGRRGRFSVALPGGSTPQALFRSLARKFADRIPWAKTHLFWGDERAVPTNDPWSNYGLADRELIAPLAIPASNIHRIPADQPPLARAAGDYEEELRGFFGATDRPSATFDLVVLGVGPDGHTASLFPGSPLIDERRRWVDVEPQPAQEPKVPRVTLTLAAINLARDAAFLVSGPEKQEAVRQILGEHAEGGHSPPAALVHPARALDWYLDEASAARLDGRHRLLTDIRTDRGDFGPDHRRG